MRTFITSNSKPLAPEAVARMIATFKLRNPHLCDDVEDTRQDAALSANGDDDSEPAREEFKAGASTPSVD
ncbi:MAG: hypothetical protein JOZ94_13215 [Xanthobacteraceae bacterium]|nr:hypothetical protein [Xanthobacteraceae bacterium]